MLIVPAAEDDEPEGQTLFFWDESEVLSFAL